MTLNKNDRKLHVALAEHGVLTVKQISAFSQRSSQVIRRQVREWEEEGLIIKKTFGYGRGKGRPEDVIFLGKEGSALLANEGIPSGHGFCERPAVHFKRLGLPYDLAVAALKTWALKNRPIDGKGNIRDSEIVSQISYAYGKAYAGYGCENEAIKPFCEPSCPVKQWKENNAT